MSGFRPYDPSATGSGSNPLLNVVHVNSESDLPNVVAQVSTLAGNTKYIFNEFSTAIRLICDEGTTLEGAGVFGGSLTYTGTLDFLTSVNVAYVLQDISISAPNANQVFNATGTSTNAVFIRSTRLTNVTKLGTFNGVAPIFNNLTVPSFTDGFSFTGGPIVGFSVVNAFFQDTDGAAVHFDLDDANFLDFEILNVIMLGTGTCISSSVGGANFVGGLEAEVQNTTFGLGAMTPLSGLTNGFQTNQWNFQTNSPTTQVDRTRHVVDYFLLDTNTVTVLVAGDFYEIGTPSVGAWASDLSDRFSVGTDGVITYTGDKTIDIEILATAALEKAGGGSDEIEGRVAINWTAGQAGEAKSRAITQNATPTSITIFANITVAPSDTIRLIFANNDGTSNVIVHSCKIDVVGG